jgi:hypothetical protein
MTFENPDEEETTRRSKLSDDNRERISILTRSLKTLGPGAVIGRNAQYVDTPYHVGVRLRGEWTHFGAGKTWEEAFGNVKKVKHQLPNGHFVFEKEEKKP